MAVCPAFAESLAGGWSGSYRRVCFSRDVALLHHLTNRPEDGLDEGGTHMCDKVLSRDRCPFVTGEWQVHVRLSKPTVKPATSQGPVAGKLVFLIIASSLPSRNEHSDPSPTL